MSLSHWKLQGPAALRLAVLVAVGAAAVGLAQWLAGPRIEAVEETKRHALTLSLLGDAVARPGAVLVHFQVRDPGLTGSPLAFAAVRLDLPGELARYVLPARSNAGYAGPIHLAVAVKADGEVQAVQVVEHRETPGLGDRIEATRSPFVEQFKGLWAGDAKLSQDGGRIDAIAQATVSSRATADAVAQASRYAVRYRQPLAAAVTGELIETCNESCD